MALTLRGVSKAYGAQAALRGVDLTLDGGVIALLGANGSGKSTLLRLLATLTQLDVGEMRFGGCVYPRDAQRLRAQIGYLPQEFEMAEGLTPRRLLTYLAGLRGGDLRGVVTALRLDALLSTPFEKLSGGQTRLVGIAQAFLGTPRLLLLDELTRGLDIVERERVFHLVSRTVTSGSDTVAIFSTHVPEEAETIASTVVVLDAGCVRYCGSVDGLRERGGGAVEAGYLDVMGRIGPKSGTGQ